MGDRGSYRGSRHDRDEMEPRAASSSRPLYADESRLSGDMMMSPDSSDSDSISSGPGNGIAIAVSHAKVYRRDAGARERLALEHRQSSISSTDRKGKSVDRSPERGVDDSYQAANRRPISLPYPYSAEPSTQRFSWQYDAHSGQAVPGPSKPKRRSRYNSLNLSADIDLAEVQSSAKKRVHSHQDVRRLPRYATEIGQSRSMSPRNATQLLHPDATRPEELVRTGSSDNGAGGPLRHASQPNRHPLRAVSDFMSTSASSRSHSEHALSDMHRPTPHNAKRPLPATTDHNDELNFKAKRYPGRGTESAGAFPVEATNSADNYQRDIDAHLPRAVKTISRSPSHLQRTRTPPKLEFPLEHRNRSESTNSRLTWTSDRTALDRSPSARDSDVSSLHRRLPPSTSLNILTAATTIPGMMNDKPGQARQSTLPSVSQQESQSLQDILRNVDISQALTLVRQAQNRDATTKTPTTTKTVSPSTGGSSTVPLATTRSQQTADEPIISADMNRITTLAEQSADVSSTHRADSSSFHDTSSILPSISDRPISQTTRPSSQSSHVYPPTASSNKVEHEEKSSKRKRLSLLGFRKAHNQPILSPTTASTATARPAPAAEIDTTQIELTQRQIEHAAGLKDEFELRYGLLFATLAQGRPLTNPAAVARWRSRRADMAARQRSSTLDTGPSNREGGADASFVDRLRPSSAKRSMWEVSAADINAYIASGGGLLDSQQPPMLHARRPSSIARIGIAEAPQTPRAGGVKSMHRQKSSGNSGHLRSEPSEYSINIGSGTRYDSPRSIDSRVTSPSFRQFGQPESERRQDDLRQTSTSSLMQEALTRSNLPQRSQTQSAFEQSLHDRRHKPNKLSMSDYSQIDLTELGRLKVDKPSMARTVSRTSSRSGTVPGLSRLLRPMRRNTDIDGYRSTDNEFGESVRSQKRGVIASSATQSTGHDPNTTPVAKPILEGVTDPVIFTPRKRATPRALKIDQSELDKGLQWVKRLDVAISHLRDIDARSFERLQDYQLRFCAASRDPAMRKLLPNVKSEPWPLSGEVSTSATGKDQSNGAIPSHRALHQEGVSGVKSRLHVALEHFEAESKRAMSAGQAQIRLADRMNNSSADVSAMLTESNEVWREKISILRGVTFAEMRASVQDTRNVFLDRIFDVLAAAFVGLLSIIWVSVSIWRGFRMILRLGHPPAGRPKSHHKMA